MQKGVSYDVIAAIIPASLLSIVILISAVHNNVAEAQGNPKKARPAVAVACGKELQKQCSGVPVQANNMLECLQKSRVSRRCAALAHNIVRMCERDAAQFCQLVVAGQGNILGCLTTARGVVSSRCNAALDAAFLRQ
jgi:Cysteine rich repeat